MPNIFSYFFSLNADECNTILPKVAVLSNYYTVIFNHYWLNLSPRLDRQILPPRTGYLKNCSKICLDVLLSFLLRRLYISIIACMNDMSLHVVVASHLLCPFFTPEILLQFILSVALFSNRYRGSRDSILLKSCQIFYSWQWW